MYNQNITGEIYNKKGDILMETMRLILIFANIALFIYLMMNKKISTLLALPLLGIITFLIVTIGSAPMAGLFSWTVGETTYNGLIDKILPTGSKMLSSAMVAAIFGAILAQLLKKTGVADKIVKVAAELAGDKPIFVAFAFYIATVLIFTAVGGLGAVILIGSISLPIMLTAGIAPAVAGAIVLLGLSTGGLMNAAGWSFFIGLVSSGGMMAEDVAKDLIANMSLIMFVIMFVLSSVFIFVNVKGGFSRTWAAKAKKPGVNREVGILPMFTPIVPVALIYLGIVLKKSVSVEAAIVFGIIWLLLTVKVLNKAQILNQSIIEGVKDVSGAIFLLIGLGILLAGFKHPVVAGIMAPAIETIVRPLTSPWTFIIGFTILTPLVLYRGPLNSWGIGGALPVLFSAAGLSPVATVWAIRGVGNLQGFGDPTNSQNIWVADFLGIDGIKITKIVIWIGFAATFFTLLYAVLVNGISLTI